ncbi:MAG: methyltransferase domain-containing protein [Propionibacteriales bacterium]|nr:methyltransferase domain-containing protein [Propionibacteriales bacterium]
MSGRAQRRAPQDRLSRPEAVRWGWHSLTDTWAARVVEAVGIEPGDVVVDVGAGEGALTVHLLRAGARVIAVDRHPRRLEVLRSRFEGLPVTVVNADVTRLRWPRQPFRVVANPPYAVTTTLLRQLVSPHNRLLSADLVLQRRVVRQILDGRAAAARRNRRDFVVQRGLTVPRTAFRPPPRVDSAVLVIRRR